MVRELTEEEIEEGYMICPISSCTEPINKPENMVKSRFDNGVMVCISCRINGN